MLCFPGLHPVRNVDHATGESGGAVVASRVYVPVSANLRRLGIFPSAMYLSASGGPTPPKPRMTNRFTRARARARRPRKNRIVQRRGQRKMAARPERNAAKKATKIGRAHV